MREELIRKIALLILLIAMLRVVDSVSEVIISERSRNEELSFVDMRFDSFLTL